MTIDCTGEDFRGLVDPYTGKPLHVKMTVASPPRFFCPDAYSTATRFPTAREAYDAWAREGGISGAREGRPIRCAYTGETLVPRHDGTGHWFEGGFDPRMLRTRAEFLRLATMRDGKSPVGVADEAHLGYVPPEPDRKPVGHETRVVQEAVDIAGEVAKRAGIPRRTQVRGAGKGARRG